MCFFSLVYYSLCDASLDSTVTGQEPLHSVDHTALSYIRKTCGWKESMSI